jgi:hypothetical protein
LCTSVTVEEYIDTVFVNFWAKLISNSKYPPDILKIALASLLYLNHFVWCSFMFVFIKWMVVLMLSLVKRWKVAVMPE